MRKKRDLPDWFLEEPLLRPGDTFYIRAFGEISTCRNNGFGMGSIPWNALAQYGHYSGLDSDMLDPFILIIRVMDQTYRDWCDAEQERMSRQNTGGTKPGGSKS